MTTITANYNLILGGPPRYLWEETEAITETVSTPIDDTLEKTKKIALGLFTTIISLPVAEAMHHAIIDLMEKLGLQITSEQEIFQIWNGIDNLPFRLLAQALKTALLGYIVVIGPMLEEWMFRDQLQTLMRGWVADPETTYNTVMRVLGNGAIFGAIHLSPFQGWANVPIFMYTFLLGCIYAGLREATGDTTASTSAHISHNGFAMYQFLKGI